jgi:hypothetical protein
MCLINVTKNWIFIYKSIYAGLTYSHIWLLNPMHYGLVHTGSCTVVSNNGV